MESSFLDNFNAPTYCFVTTSSHNIEGKITNSKMKWKETRNKGTLKAYTLVLNPKNTNSDLIFFQSINDLGDYNLSNISTEMLNGKFLSINWESLISLSNINADVFSCITDYWGILNHYWFKSENTFICSNNIFLVSALIKPKLDKEALYEYLFFNAPRKNKTWFENVNCLLPGQQLIYDKKNCSIKLSSGTDFSNLFTSNNKANPVKEIKTFFQSIQAREKRISQNKIALSAGSDSRTILACLRYFNMNPYAISFGRKDMVETQKVENLTHNLNIPWQLVSLEGFEKNFDNLFRKGTFITNGYLNPLRTHYVVLYDHLNENDALFEGILGSEFVKGEEAIGSMISLPHLDVITENSTIRISIEKYYSSLPNNFKNAMIEYISSQYQYELLDVNSSEGFESYQQFMLEFIPSRIFGGLISLLLENRVFPYYAFLSPSILKAIFNKGFGISSSASPRKDFVGPTKSLMAEALIVKALDSKIYNSLLDRNVRFKHTSYPDSDRKSVV